MDEEVWGVPERDLTLPTSTAPAAGCLLVATPLLLGEPFRLSVVYLLEHHDQGTLGVVLNRPSDTTVAETLPSWGDLATGPSVLFQGGPVQQDGALGLGSVLAGAGPVAGDPALRPLAHGIASVDLDSDAVSLVGRLSALRVFVGYAGWSAGQLDEEIEEGAWWVVPGSHTDLFAADPRSLWSTVLRRQRPPLAWFATYAEDPAAN